MTDTPHAREVDGPACTGELLDEGALVLRWAPDGREPVLFVHPDVAPRAGTPPHAGIPVCWPWFGPGPTDDAPSHGFARNAVWEHVGTTTEASGTTVSYRLTDAEATHPAWPHPYRLELTAVLADTLTISLTTHNTGDEDVVVGEALHAYLAVGDVREAVVTGLDGARYHDKVTDEDEVQSGDLVLGGRTDRVYCTTGAVVVEDPVLRRRLRVEADGASCRVVWNPWDDLAADLDDVGEAWPRFVCVEAANVLDDVVTVPAGGSHTLTYRLTVEDA
ncbi:D-hexose-6-phosphate mutarotase [Phycicoccus flavus]|uniref:D-hexose-6-phosphate mutarotase n=1 Tax=Phycicoccus flavus TaxID=2502783 RepID=UPI000FEB8AEC|nr:D-hexose-6-phosphate mutarotase [Phycicoccus flavus]NHA66586.1 D-hexose-6-phosphate mutarotase [Phycicoccus flavus]